VKTITKVSRFFRQKKLYQMLFWLWLCFILMNSLLPKQISSGPTTNDTFFIRTDYIMHFMGYCLLALLFFLWKSNKYFIIPGNQLLIFLAFATSIAIGSEIAQKFIPGRGYNAFDFIANILGVSVGIIVPWLYFKKSNKAGERH